MASATDTTKREGLRAVLSSRIAQIIFIWNFAGLAFLVIGVLLLTEMRAGLTDAQFRNLRTQGELITNLLIETGSATAAELDAIDAELAQELTEAAAFAFASPKSDVAELKRDVYADELA